MLSVHYKMKNRTFIHCKDPVLIMGFLNYTLTILILIVQPISIFSSLLPKVLRHLSGVTKLCHRL